MAKARGQINGEIRAEHILASGDSSLVECWQPLDGTSAHWNRIVAIARQFGPRARHFPMIEPYANATRTSSNDTAIWCAAGNLEQTAPRSAGPARHRQSPLFAVPLRLNTLDEATERLRVWSCAQWEQQHRGRAPGTSTSDGELHDTPRPPNPYAPCEHVDVG